MTMIQTKMYLHSNKKNNLEAGRELGLSGDALENFQHALHEVEFDIEVDDTSGETKILKVNGRKMEVVTL